MQYQANSMLPPFRFRARRGQLIGVRQAMPEDTALLAGLLIHLSERAPHMHDLGSISIADDRYWRRAFRLTQAQSSGHTTFVATQQTGDCEEAIGIAELTRDWNDATVGEIAVVVRGDVQKQGIGSSLLWRLVYEAQRAGMTHLSVRMAEQDTATLRLIRAMKLPYTAITRRAETRALVSLPMRLSTNTFARQASQHAL